MIENSFPCKNISDCDIREKFPPVSKSSRRSNTSFEVCGVEFGSELIPIMAGPNMVESEELILDVASSVKTSGAHFLRGGAFKPLTFPYRSDSYCESGAQGLKWLQKAKDDVGIPIIK